MKPTLTLKLRTLGFGAMIALGAILAVMPSRIAGASLETRLAEVAARIPEDGFGLGPAELAEWLTSGKSVALVDLREHWEFDEFHIEGATRASLAALVSPGGVRGLPGGPVVVIGRDDAAPAQAAAILRLAGVEAYVLRGGMAGWWREVLTPASMDASVPPQDRPTVAARRLRWRARFLGAHAPGQGAGPGVSMEAPSPGGSVPVPPPAARPPAPPSGATRGKGC